MDSYTKSELEIFQILIFFFHLVISESDCIGAIAMIVPDNGAIAADADVRLASILAAVLSSEMAQ